MVWCVGIIVMTINLGAISEALAVSERGIRVVEGLHNFSGKSWAVVIGIDQYEAAPRLSYAVADAKALAVALRRFKFEVREFYNERASRAVLYHELFDELSDRVTEQDRVLIFFAGHGETKQLRNGKQIGYLLPADGNLDILAETGLSMSAIRDLADALPAKHVLFLVDACYGGVAGQRFRGIPKMTENYLREVTRERGRQLITAGGVDQQALEGPEWGHSVFTYYLLQGLEKGLADLNDDGIIPASELYTYLDQRVFSAAALKGYAQRPELWTMAAERGEFVFVPADTISKTGSSAVEKTVSSKEAISSRTNQADVHSPGKVINVTPTLDRAPASEALPPHVTVLESPELYFPRTLGSQWRYRGELSDRDQPVQNARGRYQNVSSIQPMERFNGEMAKVIVETNPGNRGRTVTYFKEDQTGIIVEGWQPSQLIFKEVLPYYAVRFPVEIPSRFSQFQRKNVLSDMDVDGDGKSEAVDVMGESRVIGKETIEVPAGRYADALRIDFVVTITAHMTKDKSTMTMTSSGSRWYARNIGLVKELNETRTSSWPSGHQDRIVSALEELESCAISP
jgi:hypothetical protein